MKRAQCPSCHKDFPVLIFTGNRVLQRKGDIVEFICPFCRQKLQAQSNESHRKNFMWILLVPLFASPLIVSLQGFVSSGWKFFYFFVCYAICLAIPTIIGQHKMSFQLLK